MPSSWKSLDEHWKQRAQYEVNEDTAKIEANIHALRALVQGEKGLYSRTDDTFLLAFLRARKHNVNEAFKLLTNFYKIKESFPKRLQPHLPSEKSNIYDIEAMTVLDQKDDEGRAIIIIIVENTDFKKVPVEEYFQLITTVMLFCCEDQYIQISGITVIVDLKGLGFQHVIHATPTNMSLYIKMFQDVFPLRLKSIHIVNHSTLFTPVFALAKQFMKEKMRRRIHFHGANMSSLHEYIPYEILPKQLGGLLPNFNFSSFRNKLQQCGDITEEKNPFLPCTTSANPTLQRVLSDHQGEGPNQEWQRWGGSASPLSADGALPSPPVPSPLCHPRLFL